MAFFGRKNRLSLQDIKVAENAERASSYRPYTLETVFAELGKYGKLYVHQFNDGQYKVAVINSGKGLYVEIKSDLNHPTLMEAALCCLDRCRGGVSADGTRLIGSR